ncbi:MAG: matrixin family metalloprotease [Acidobacteria bacterium]|nr:matrixin family metalloprotease [Acidobacteriota bacterium]
MKNHFAGGVVAAWTLLVYSAAAQHPVLPTDSLWLKTKPFVKSGQRDAAASASPKRLNALRWHWLVIFPNPPTPVDVALLESRNARAVQFVPPRALIATAETMSSFSGLPVDAAYLLEPEQKISPVLIDQQILREGFFDPAEQLLLVEFYPDVTRPEMTAIVTTESAVIEEHPDLLPWQLLVRGKPADLVRLASWDEVSYLFPASTDLINRNPVESCAGALTGNGMVGQIVNRVGEGWDGPGLGAVSIGYFFSSYTGRISPEKIRSEIQRAMAEWARVVKLTFYAAASADSRIGINVMFASGDHGDGYAFDGTGKTLGHTFYPSPPNPEPIAGDLHFDDDESWTSGGALDLYSVALHELGHAFGLAHSDNPSAVMYPYYRKVTTLHAEDVAAIQSMYASASSPPPPAALALSITSPQLSLATTDSSVVVTGGTSGGQSAGQVSWVNSMGGSGVATGWRAWNTSPLLLVIGENVITVTAVDAAGVRATQSIRVTRQSVATGTPALLQITSPVASGTFRTAERSVALSGTLSAGPAVTRINWLNGAINGGSQLASANWTTPPIPLDPGSNHITVMAVDTSGKSISAAIVVDCSPSAPPTSSGADRSAPTLAISSPASSAFSTFATTFTITGTASDNVGIKDITWTSSANRSGLATGGANWRIDVPLALGSNVILIQASDAAGNLSWVSLTITRQ